MNAFKKKHTDFLATKKFTELLDCTEIHLENFLSNNDQLELKKIFKVNKKKYTKFINNFLKFKNENSLPLWEKIFGELKSIKASNLYENYTKAGY